MFSGCTFLETFNFNSPASGITCKNTVGYQFASMFQSCTALTSVTNFNLHVNGAAPYCCQNMFRGSKLKDGPVLSGIRPYTGSFQSMFENCYYLTGISLYLSATAESCCNRMFYGCELLGNFNNSITITNQTDTSCYKSMFQSCGLYLPPSIKIVALPLLIKIASSLLPETIKCISK